MNDNKTVKERYEAEPKTFALIYLDIIKERNRWRGIAAFLAATSLLLTNSSTCLSKTLSYPQSLPIAVRTDVLVLREIHGIAFLFFISH